MSSVTTLTLSVMRMTGWALVTESLEHFFVLCPIFYINIVIILRTVKACRLMSETWRVQRILLGAAASNARL